MSMFDLMIPEIDSFNEEVRLIAKDRKISVIYLAFNLLKLLYERTICFQGSDERNYVYHGI